MFNLEKVNGLYSNWFENQKSSTLVKIAVLYKSFKNLIHIECEWVNTEIKQILKFTTQRKKKLLCSRFGFKAVAFLLRSKTENLNEIGIEYSSLKVHHLEKLALVRN